MLLNNSKKLIVLGVALIFAVTMFLAQSRTILAAGPCDADTQSNACLNERITKIETLLQQLIAASHPVTPTTSITTTMNVGTPGGYTPQQVLELLVPDVNEQPFMTAARVEGDHWVLTSAKTSRDSNGVPCCGVRVTFALSAGGHFEYWGGDQQPIGSGFTVQGGIDAGSAQGYKNWQVDAQKGSSGKFISDGVSWTPPLP